MSDFFPFILLSYLISIASVTLHSSKVGGHHCTEKRNKRGDAKAEEIRAVKEALLGSGTSWLYWGLSVLPL